MKKFNFQTILSWVFPFVKPASRTLPNGEPDPASMFSRETLKTAEALVESAVSSGGVKINLGAAFVDALSYDLQGTEADLSFQPARNRGNVAYNALKTIFNDVNGDESAEYVHSHATVLTLGLGMSAATLNL